MSLRGITFSTGIVTAVYGMTFSPFFLGEFLSFQPPIAEVKPVRERPPVTFISMVPPEPVKSEAVQEEEQQDQTAEDTKPQEEVALVNTGDSIQRIRLRKYQKNRLLRLNLKKRSLLLMSTRTKSQTVHLKILLSRCS